MYALKKSRDREIDVWRTQYSLASLGILGETELGGQEHSLAGAGVVLEELADLALVVSQEVRPGVDVWECFPAKDGTR